MKNVANHLVLVDAIKGSEGHIACGLTLHDNQITNAVKSAKQMVDGAYLVLQKAAISSDFYRLQTFARLSDRPARGRRFHKGPKLPIMMAA